MKEEHDALDLGSRFIDLAVSIYSCFFDFAESIRFNFKLRADLRLDVGGFSLTRDVFIFASLEAHLASSDFFLVKLSLFFDRLLSFCEFLDPDSITLHKFFNID